MRYVSKLIMKRQRQSKQGFYTLYTYELVNEKGLDPYEVDSTTPYEPGARVEVWFSSQWDKPKMKLHIDKHKKL